MSAPLISAAARIETESAEIPRSFGAALRRADEFIKLAVAAAAKVINPIEEDQENPIETGLFVGTAFGPMQTNFDVLGLIADENQTSPTLFSHSVFNSAAGYLARLYNIQGSSQTFTDFSWPFFQALNAGSTAIASGRLRQCLVVQVETYSDLLLDAREQTCPTDDTWPSGAVAWLLTSQGEQKYWRLDDLNITRSAAQAAQYLHRQETLQEESNTNLCPSPLSAAQILTDRLNQAENSRSSLHCSLSAPYGSVDLKFSRNI